MSDRTDRFPEKMDALDLIINALKDHEKRLDEISHQIQSLLQDIVLDKPKLKEMPSREKKRETKIANKVLPVIHCANWIEFKNQYRSQRTALVTFQIDDQAFSVNTMVNDLILRYTEPLPNKRLQIIENTTSFSFDKTSLSNLYLLEVIINRRLKCGLPLQITSQSIFDDPQYFFVLNFKIPPSEVKNFLANELDIPKKNIIAGNITS